MLFTFVLMHLRASDQDGCDLRRRLGSSEKGPPARSSASLLSPSARAIALVSVCGAYRQLAVNELIVNIPWSRQPGYPTPGSAFAGQILGHIGVVIAVASVAAKGSGCGQGQPPRATQLANPVTSVIARL